MRRYAVPMVLGAGILWGTMGVFVRSLEKMGFDSVQITALRLVCGAVMLWIVLAVTGRARTGVKIRDMLLFAAMGIISLLCMSLLYFYTITASSLSVAAILLYLSPVMVTLMAAVFLKEPLTGGKLLCLVLAVAGCALVSGVLGGEGIGLRSLLTGVGSSVAYGSYSIFGTFALKKHEPLVVTTWSFTFAALGSVIVAGIPEMGYKIAACQGYIWEFVGLVLATAFVTAAVPYLMYTTGLKYMPAAHAAIAACIEPLTAALCGLVFYSEGLGIPELVGIVMILGAIVLLNTGVGRPASPGGRNSMDFPDGK